MEICCWYRGAVMQHQRTTACLWQKNCLLTEAAVHYKLTAGSCHCSHTYGDLLFRQGCSDLSPMQYSLLVAKCIAFCLKLLYIKSRKQACVTVATSMGICCYYRTACGNMHRVLLEADVHNKLTAGSCYCSHTYRDLLFTQWCSDPSPVNHGTACGNLHCLLVEATVHDKLKAGLWHCSHTYGDLLFIQGCSDAVSAHYSLLVANKLPPA